MRTLDLGARPNTAFDLTSSLTLAYFTALS